MTKKIAIIGLGFVGLSFAVVLASKGYRVLVIDSNKDKISKIQGGDPTFYEPKLSSFLQKALKKTSFQISSKIEKAVNDCDVIFITVGTPLSKKNKLDLRYIKSVVKEIASTSSRGFLFETMIQFLFFSRLISLTASDSIVINGFWDAKIS